MNKRLKTIQIGVEHDHGGVTMESAKKLAHDFEIVAYADPHPEDIVRSNGDRRFIGDTPILTVEQALNIDGLDCVIIETHDTKLAKYGKLAADLGLPMHVDKPCGTDYASVAKLIDTCKEKNIVFQSGYMYRFNPAVKYALDAAKKGVLGEIFSVEAHMDCEHKPEKREWLNSVPGGMMMFLGCHLVDLILQFAGKPDSIECKSCKTGLEEVNSLDYGMALFNYKNGVSFAKTCAREVGGFGRRQLVVCGSEATIEIKPLEAYFPDTGDMYTEATIVMHKDTNYNWGIDRKRDLRFGPYDRYEAMMHEFAQMVRGEIENPYTYDYEKTLYECIIKACGLPM